MQFFIGVFLLIGNVTLFDITFTVVRFIRINYFYFVMYYGFILIHTGKSASLAFRICLTFYNFTRGAKIFIIGETQLVVLLITY